MTVRVEFLQEILDALANLVGEMGRANSNNEFLGVFVDLEGTRRQKSVYSLVDVIEADSFTVFKLTARAPDDSLERVPFDTSAIPRSLVMKRIAGNTERASEVRMRISAVPKSVKSSYNSDGLMVSGMMCSSK